MIRSKFFIVSNFLTLIIFIIKVNGHARLLKPISRSSAWRQNPLLFPTFYNDNQMSCGGYVTHWLKNDGKCGICGDEVHSKQFEKGGKYYRGIKVKSYNKNDLIETDVEVTVNHKGYFEFRLCSLDELNGLDATQECLDKNLLINSNGKTRTYLPKDFIGKITTFLKIPTDFQCNHCVLQWKHVTANSWNKDLTSGKGCIGCGPQEHFYGCSDISIESNKDSNSNTKKISTTKLNHLIKTSTSRIESNKFSNFNTKKTSTSKLNHLKKTSTNKLIHLITKLNKKSKQH